jgi:transposase
MMEKPTRFQPYDRDQLMLLPVDVREWVPRDHLAHWICDVVEELDLSEIYADYDGSRGGKPPYHPKMMVSLLLYAYCTGVPSSRRIEAATYESLPFMLLTANQHPDHDTIAEFRRRHLKALARLFKQVLDLCRGAGLVKLGHVALDGTKVRANASKHRAMSYDRMQKKEKELEQEIADLLALAEAVDAEEDLLYGKGNGRTSLPEELQFRQARLEKIREAKQALEDEAKAAADQQRAELAEAEAKPSDSNPKGKKSKRKKPSDKPAPKAQRNFTDPESRIMRDGATKSFEQCYNAQAAVDSHSQIIVSTNVTQEANDKKQLEPLLEKLKINTDGQKPQSGSADYGYYSEENVKYCEDEEIDAYISTNRQKHGSKAEPAPCGRIPGNATTKERMTRKLRTIRGRCTYSKRKEIVEPVFGQIKQERGFRQFLLRGLEKVSGEWDLICLTHNLLKLFRGGWAAAGGC